MMKLLNSILMSNLAMAVMRAQAMAAAQVVMEDMAVAQVVMEDMRRALDMDCPVDTLQVDQADGLHRLDMEAGKQSAKRTNFTFKKNCRLNF